MKNWEKCDEDTSMVQDDNISINEIINILSRQKITIIVTMVTMLLLAATYLLLVKPVYESRAVIVIGKITQQGTPQQGTSLEEPLLLVQRIKENYKVGDTTAGGKDLPALTAVDIDKKIANIVTFKAQANSPKEAQEYLASVVMPLLAEHQNLYFETNSLKENRLLAVEHELKDIDKENAEITRQSHVLVNQDGAMVALLLMEKERLGERRLVLQKQLIEVKATMLEINNKPTVLLSEPTIPSNPTISKLLIISMAAIMGIFLGLMAAFMKEYIEIGRKKKTNLSHME